MTYCDLDIAINIHIRCKSTMSVNKNLTNITDSAIGSLRAKDVWYLFNFNFFKLLSTEMGQSWPDFQNIFKSKRLQW